MSVSVSVRCAIEQLCTHVGMIAAATACLLLAACATYRPLEEDERSGIDTVLEPGDDVRIVTRSGERIELTVDSVEENAIVGSDRRVLVSDILTIEVKRFNKRLAWIIAGSIAGALLLVDYEDDDDCIECFPVFP